MIQYPGIGMGIRLAQRPNRASRPLTKILKTVDQNGTKNTELMATKQMGQPTITLSTSGFIHWVRNIQSALHYAKMNLVLTWVQLAIIFCVNVKGWGRNVLGCFGT